MQPSSFAAYAQNAFWLVAPILLCNLLLFRRLPPTYQSEAFSRGVPRWVTLPESLLRVPVFLLPLVLHVDVDASRWRPWFVLYVSGTLLYFASWLPQLLWPSSRWSISAAGFMAPSYTPATWLFAIGLGGDRLTISSVPYRRSAFWGIAAAFLVFHNIHTWLVHFRLHRAPPPATPQSSPAPHQSDTTTQPGA